MSSVTNGLWIKLDFAQERLQIISGFFVQGDVRCYSKKPFFSRAIDIHVAGQDILVNHRDYIQLLRDHGFSQLDQLGVVHLNLDQLAKDGKFTIVKDKSHRLCEQKTDGAEKATQALFDSIFKGDVKGVREAIKNCANIDEERAYVKTNDVYTRAWLSHLEDIPLFSLKYAREAKPSEEKPYFFYHPSKCLVVTPFLLSKILRVAEDIGKMLLEAQANCTKVGMEMTFAYKCVGCKESYSMESYPSGTVIGLSNQLFELVISRTERREISRDSSSGAICYKELPDEVKRNTYNASSSKVITEEKRGWGDPLLKNFV